MKKRKNKQFQLTTPILLLTFNRPNETKKVFEEIKKAKPKQLFISSDGPRNSNEKKIINEIRKHLLNNIDWKCNIKTLFRNKNLGCKYAVSGAIDWFFENVEQGIILEDDCLPDQSFFRFCEETLKRYEDNERIMQISGTNIEKVSNIKESYFFSEPICFWGWATWKRAWKKNDIYIKDWKKYRFSSKYLSLVKNQSLLVKINTWRIFNIVYKGKADCWGYQWVFACNINRGLSVIPKKNLIKNIGFEIGKNTTNYDSKEKSLERHELAFPLKHPPKIKSNLNYIKNYEKFFMKGVVKRKTKKFLRR